MPLSTGWSASRLTPRTGLPGTPLGGAAPTSQQNSVFAQIAQLLGIKPPVVEPALSLQPAFRGAPQTGPLPAAGIDYLARAATAGTPAERAADKIATAAEAAKIPAPVPVPDVTPRSAPGAFSQSGNIALPSSVYQAASLSPLQSGLAQALGIAPAAAAPSPTIAGTPITPAPSVGGIVGLSGGGLPTGGLAPGQRPYVSPLNAIAPQVVPVTNATIPGVTNFNTLANQSQNMPPWLLNAIQNLNNPDNFTPPAPLVPVGGGGFDPRIGATMAATEARIAAQQKELAEANKLRIQKAKAEAAAAEHAHELQVQRQRFSSPTFGGYGTGWTSPTF